MILLLGFLGAAYLFGAIPTGVWVSCFKGVDIRRQGSGNVGATNVARVAGKLPGLLVLTVDVLKGWIPVTAFASAAVALKVPVSPEVLRMELGLVAVAGHVFNPFLKFQGGRGVATSLGVLFGLDSRVALSTLGVWIVVLFVTRYVSVASVSAALAAPFLMTAWGLPISWILGGIAISLLVIGRHRPNLLRLLHGEEHRV